MGYADHQVRPNVSEGGERDAFDRWLRRSLRQAHDDIIAEPVPDALLAILGEPSPDGASGGRAPSGRSVDPATSDAQASAGDPSHRAGAKRRTSGREA